MHLMDFFLPMITDSGPLLNQTHVLVAEKSAQFINMPLPFELVQKLYAAHFPYSWITWEGKLWEDPENQPNLEKIIEECEGYVCLVKEILGWSAYWEKHPFGCPVGLEAIDVFMTKREEGSTPSEAVCNLWLSIPHPTPRPEHVDMPTSLTE